MGNRYSKELATRRFWRNVEVVPGGCWLWRGGRFPNGYGRFSLSHRAGVGAHRFMYELVHGAIPTGLCILHRCDNPPCVSPAHLFAGTHADNAHDRDAKGRAAAGSRHWSKVRPDDVVRGERHGRSKLTVMNVLLIRKAVSRGVSSRRLARKYGVSKTSIQHAANGRNWAWLAPQP